ncbi:phage gp36-like protein [Neisseria perflava]|uniref:phage protein Gp36 family protein n=1 Tax=Neisseria perflava TaxID=33053 RepID=UPI00209FC54B|nr:phage protein Gp36 family protein [Neisseria perflava]MCP1772856.1 phage gp36-like protein [Neisseria perflava]
MITREDMLARFAEREIAQLTDHENGRTINDEVLQRAIDDAAAEAGSYLRAAGFQTLPEPTPRVLAVKVCDIARYYLHEDGVIDIVEARYKSAVEWLKALVKNPNLLGLDVSAAATRAAEASGSAYAVRPNQAEGWGHAPNRRR